jgi:hypothetical protein
MAYIDCPQLLTNKLLRLRMLALPREASVFIVSCLTLTVPNSHSRTPVFLAEYSHVGAVITWPYWSSFETRSDRVFVVVTTKDIGMVKPMGTKKNFTCPSPPAESYVSLQAVVLTPVA